MTASFGGEEEETQAGGSRHTSPSPIKGGLARFDDSASPYRGSASKSLHDTGLSKRIFLVDDAARGTRASESARGSERKSPLEEEKHHRRGLGSVTE